ncbi:hypothetical protein [Chelativorans salis]|uniref:Uncharacterized protein n=1 Tax=Chelativorans salis TaxID=2978478 RepID=A0ABT2LRC8_9HYPH|nr:hypothetical protein [Chelativorans sp. EGI FJ00035]MCT7375739.1 hypothetical protein [Chelativorans sp. EGI FJ00035]
MASPQLSSAGDEALVHLTVHWWNFPRPLIANLRKRFPELSALEAVQVLREASDLARGGANGRAS